MGSLSKAEIGFIKGLQRKKERKQSGLFLIEGEKLLREAAKGNVDFERVFLREDASFLEQFPDAQIISESDMRRISALHSGSPALAVVRMKGKGWRRASVRPKRILALDGITDPGNMGTILRRADWFGVDHLLIAEGSVDLFNTKTVQATMGSLFHLSWEIGTLPALLAERKDQGYIIWVTHLEGEGTAELSNASDDAILVIGSESHGVSEEVDAVASKRLKIPGMGDAESLNAGVAASIALYAWTC